DLQNPNTPGFPASERSDARERVPEIQNRVAFTDYLLPGAAVLLGGLAGVGFAGLFPLAGAQSTATPDRDLVFYWAVLAGALVLILEGGRDPVKLAVGL